MSAAEAAAHRVVLMTSAGQKHFAQCLFSCLALTNKVYGSSMENVCCFSLFLF